MVIQSNVSLYKYHVLDGTKWQQTSSGSEPPGTCNGCERKKEGTIKKRRRDREMQNEGPLCVLIKILQ